MATQVRLRSRGLRMPLLALTASASIVTGVFIAATPAYSVDETGEVPEQCLTASEESAFMVVSSIVHAGAPVHAEGAGWGPSSDKTRGFVVVTLDDGREKRPDDVVLPSWVPASVVRNKAAWTVAEVTSDGSFSVDIAVPATWEVGSRHQIAIGDGVTGTYVQVQVFVVDAGVAIQSCTLKPTDPPTTDPDGKPDSPDDPGTETPTSSPGGSGADRAAAVPTPTADPTGATWGGRRDADSTDTSAPEVSAPTPSAAPSEQSSPGSSATSSPYTGGDGAEPTPEASASSEKQSVSASQIGPKAHTEQQATNQAARERESRLTGWILAGGGLLALLGAIVTVSIVRRLHGPIR